jgi:hypothetical protein
MTPDFIVKPDGGLCNYLRVIFSYLKYCKRENKTLGVIWEITRDCPGFFLDYFEPLDGVVFFKDSRLRADIYGNRWHQDYDPYEMFIYDGLKLLPKIQEKIKATTSKLENYIAVHIRRTDHVTLAKAEEHYTDDNEFINFVNQYPEFNIYIATDNRETQDQFYALYKDRIKVIDFIRPSLKLRQTTLEEAILDMFICIGASHFKGSGWSSFSATIEQYRQDIDNEMRYTQRISY